MTNPPSNNLHGAHCLQFWFASNARTAHVLFRNMKQELAGLELRQLVLALVRDGLVQESAMAIKDDVKIPTTITGRPLSGIFEYREMGDEMEDDLEEDLSINGAQPSRKRPKMDKEIKDQSGPAAGPAGGSPMEIDGAKITSQSKKSSSEEKYDLSDLRDTGTSHLQPGTQGSLQYYAATQSDVIPQHIKDRKIQDFVKKCGTFEGLPRTEGSTDLLPECAYMLQRICAGSMTLWAQHVEGESLSIRIDRLLELVLQIKLEDVWAVHVSPDGWLKVELKYSPLGRQITSELGYMDSVLWLFRKHLIIPSARFGFRTSMIPRLIVHEKQRRTKLELDLLDSVKGLQEIAAQNTELKNKSDRQAEMLKQIMDSQQLLLRQGAAQVQTPAQR